MKPNNHKAAHALRKILTRYVDDPGESKSRLLKAGYAQLSERETWKLELGGKFFFTRNHSTILAFAIGKKYGCVSIITYPCQILGKMFRCDDANSKSFL